MPEPLDTFKSSDGSSPLAMSPEEFRRLGYRAVDLAAEYLAGLAERPVFSPMTPDERASLLQQPLEPTGSAPEEILDRFAEAVLPYAMGNGHPRFFGWVNSAPAPVAILAELLAATMNPSCAGGDHAAIYLEHCAVRWLKELIGFPVEGSYGILVSGGSAASLTGLAAARHWAAQRAGWDVRAEGLPGDHPRLVLYHSEEIHSCVKKAAELLGLGSAALRPIPVDDAFKLRVDALRAAIAADRTAGRRPFAVAASAGTVNTGAIDPLDEIADVCAAEDLWFHVDGAYGAVGVLDPAVAPRYRGLERADSVALDPHKWLNVPVECGCALVRDGSILRETFSLVPPYLRTEPDRGFGGLPWFSEYGSQQSRGFRALKLWMTLQMAGRDGYATLISRHNQLARQLAGMIDAAPDLERLAPVELSIVCFRYVPDSRRGDDARLNALNKRIMETIQAEGETFLTNASLRGTFALRACILHHATTASDVAALVEIVRKVGARLARD
ncbi:MAG TPA: aminotransferase class V-fold PLP-dependent enzyme [Chloroflexota bacterium]|nr:aminotransferase class V-fold PLP-dependent enzyme [Chloroflexota bacterium]